MGLYRRFIFPRICDFVLGQVFVSKHRRALLEHAHGDVLEIGFGTGLNLPHYPRHIHKLICLDPNTGMHRLAKRRIAESGLVVESHAAMSEAMPFDAGRFDCVVSTFTLCSVFDAAASLREVYRVLKPSGLFLFLEHGLCPDPNVQKWQRRLNWLEQRLADGCHLDRDIKQLVSAVPFARVDWTEFSLEHTPRTHGAVTQGRGVK